jgi:Ca2+-binding EF-hand superfamily protein
VQASLQKVINKYDKSKTGKLSEEELGNLLQVCTAVGVTSSQHFTS